MLWPDIIQFGRITSDVITGMSVTDFTTVGHIAILNTFATHFENTPVSVVIPFTEVANTAFGYYKTFFLFFFHIFRLRSLDVFSFPILFL